METWRESFRGSRGERRSRTRVFEISILSPPEPVTDPEEIAIGRDGLILEARGRSGLLLPQVATEWGFDREAFLGEVARKAGLPREAWKDPETKLWRFQAEVFAESESKIDGGGI